MPASPVHFLFRLVYVQVGGGFSICFRLLFAKEPGQLRSCKKKKEREEETGRRTTGSLGEIGWYMIILG
jgi:uncharacterized membrane protein YgaE (UPF0421/DUF939 family)